MLAHGLMLGRSSPSFLVDDSCWRKAPTCRRTLAVSRGKVRRSAKQAAVPAPRNFTAVVGGTSGGWSPTMVLGGWACFLWCLLRCKERGCLEIPLLQFREEAAGEGQGNRWRQGCLALSHFQGTHSTLKGLYRVRSLGTATLKLPKFGWHNQVISHLSHLPIPVTSAQRVEGGSRQGRW